MSQYPGHSESRTLHLPQQKKRTLGLAKNWNHHVPVGSSRHTEQSPSRSWPLPSPLDSAGTQSSRSSTRKPTISIVTALSHPSSCRPVGVQGARARTTQNCTVFPTMLLWSVVWIPEDTAPVEHVLILAHLVLVRTLILDVTSNALRYPPRGAIVHRVLDVAC